MKETCQNCKWFNNKEWWRMMDFDGFCCFDTRELAKRDNNYCSNFKKRTQEQIIEDKKILDRDIKASKDYNNSMNEQFGEMSRKLNEKYEKKYKK